MYNYNFGSEKVLKEETNVTLKCDKTYFTGSLLVTNKNLLIFYDANKDSALKGSGVQVMPEYALLAKINLKNIKYEQKDGQVNINNIIIYNFDLKNFLN